MNPLLRILGKLLLLTTLLTSCMPRAINVPPPTYPVSNIADLIKLEKKYSHNLLAPQRSEIERIFWDLDRLTAEQSKPLFFAVEDRCFELHQQSHQTFPTLYQADCSSRSREEVLLRFASVLQGELKRIDAIRISPDASKVAFAAVTTTNNRTLLIVEAGSGTLLHATEAPYGFEWFNDSRHLLFSRLGSNGGELWISGLQDQTSRQVAGSNNAEEYFYITRSSSGRYLLIDQRALATHRWGNIDADNTAILHYATARVGADEVARCDTASYWIEARELLRGSGAIYITAKGPPHTADTREIPTGWQIASLDCFASHAIVTLQDGWHKRLYVLDPAQKGMRSVVSDATWVSLVPMQPFQSDTIEIVREGPAEKPSNCRIPLDAHVLADPGCKGVNHPDLETAELEAMSSDGRMVPVTVLFSKGFKEQREKVALLHTYGAYGIILPSAYDPTIIPLLNRGIAVVFANIRGGGGRGRGWQHAGLRKGKMLAVSDIQAVAKLLVGHGFVKRGGLFGKARSAGVPLLLTAAQADKDLFKGLILDAPVLRPATLVTATNTKLVGREKLEWGDPANGEDAAVLRKLDGIASASSAILPPVFLSFSPYDEEVSLEDILEWIALRRNNAQTNTLVVFPTFASSHQGSDFRDAQNRLLAEQYGFLFH